MLAQRPSDGGAGRGWVPSAPGRWGIPRAPASRRSGTVADRRLDGGMACRRPGRGGVARTFSPRSHPSLVLGSGPPSLLISRWRKLRMPRTSDSAPLILKSDPHLGAERFTPEGPVYTASGG